MEEYKVSDKNTQNERIMAYLKQHGTINPMEALKELSVMRLASRISELRLEWKAPIEKTTRTRLNQFGEIVRFAEYRLKDPNWEKESA